MRACVEYVCVRVYWRICVFVILMCCYYTQFFLGNSRFVISAVCHLSVTNSSRIVMSAVCHLSVIGSSRVVMSAVCHLSVTGNSRVVMSAVCHLSVIGSSRVVMSAVCHLSVSGVLLCVLVSAAATPMISLPRHDLVRPPSPRYYPFCCKL